MWYTAFEYYLYYIVFQHISFLEYYYHYNIYAIVLIRLHRTAGPSRCLFFIICNVFVVCKTSKTATIHGYCLIVSHTLPTIRANVVYFWSTYTKVSALHWYSYYCGLVYSIDIISRTIQGDFFIVLHVVKRFLWYR